MQKQSPMTYMRIQIKSSTLNTFNNFNIQKNEIMYIGTSDPTHFDIQNYLF